MTASGWVLRRTDQGGGWVARQGHAGSYTGKLQYARVFASRELAEQERCPGNEVAERIEDVMAGGRGYGYGR